MQIALNELSCSALTKTLFRDRFSKIQKSVLDQQKAAAKADNKRVLDTITDFFAQEENEAKKHLVAKVEWNATVNKAIIEAIKTVSGKGPMKDKSVYLFSANEEEGKVVHGCYVAEVSETASLIFSILPLLERIEIRDPFRRNLLMIMYPALPLSRRFSCRMVQERRQHHQRQGRRQRRYFDRPGHQC